MEQGMVTMEDAREVVPVVVEAVRPLSVTVFGSVARESRGNDLDLLIVVDRPASDIPSVEFTVHQALKPFYSRFAIDPFVVSRGAAQESSRGGSPFMQLVSAEGRVVYMGPIVDDWFRQAGDDLATARYLLQGGYYRNTCFHAQQAIEKHLKARLLKAGWQLQKIHQVERLCALAREYHVPVRLSDDDVVFVDSIYRGRYPGDQGLLPMGNPSREDAERACSIAESLLSRE